MSSHFIESLELRQFLSAGPVGAGMEEADCREAETMELRTLRGSTARRPNMKGIYVGTSRTRFGTVTITLNIKRQDRQGRWSGTVTGPGLRFTITGRVNVERESKFTFAGRDEDGAAAGSGTAKLSKRGGKVTGKFTETEGRVTYSGTLNLQKV